jgi:hypothetical protein
LTALLLLACFAAPASTPPAEPRPTVTAAPPSDPLAALLSPDLADGFDLPIGDGDGVIPPFGDIAVEGDPDGVCAEEVRRGGQR